MDVWKFVLPYRFKFLRSRLAVKNGCTCLDVGSGPNSPRIFRHWFPGISYHAVDRLPRDDLDVAEALPSRYFQKDLENDRLDDIDDLSYDAVIFSHVIEHLTNGLAVLSEVSKKVKVGGYIFVETPSLRTLSLPHADGFLHFHDDVTHKRLYVLEDMANTLLSKGFKIVKGGTRRDPFGVFVIGPAAILYNVAYYLKNRRIYGSPLWDLFGVSTYVLAKRTLPPREGDTA